MRDCTVWIADKKNLSIVRMDTTAINLVGFSNVKLELLQQTIIWNAKTALLVLIVKREYKEHAILEHWLIVLDRKFCEKNFELDEFYFRWLENRVIEIKKRHRFLWFSIIYWNPLRRGLLILFFKSYWRRNVYHVQLEWTARIRKHPKFVLK